MIDIQLMTLVIALFAILGSSFWTRKSIEDMRDVLRAEANERFTKLDARIDRMETRLDRLTR